MNRRSILRIVSLGAAAALGVGTLAGCSTGGGGDDGQVTITWWHNATQEPLNSVWEDVAAEFEEANPGVNVEVTGYQNEELQRTLIPNALRAGGDQAPDLFQQWGAGELAAQVEAGYLMDLSDQVGEELDAIGATAAPWQLDGATYGLPFSFGVEGFWYNTELFEQAGITEAPTTLDELNDAVATLKDAGITPIAVGAGDGWPAAHYWYNFALKSCSPDTLQQAQTDLDFSDPCFVEAGELMEEFIGTEPFQEGFLATPAQQGAGSSAGLLANGQAAMELMGHWNPGVMGGLTPDGEIPEFLGWFNFPGIDGTDGDPTAALGGGDGYSCGASAPPECVDLLKYIMSPEVQARYGETGSGVPVVAGTEDSVGPELQPVLQGRNSATYVQLWLDTSYGPTVGGAMNDAIGQVFAGQGDAQSIVDAMDAAAATV